MTLNLVLGEMPDFSLPQDRLESSIGICPSWQYAEKAWYEYTINEIPEKPLLFGVVKHPRNNKRVMTMFVYPLPYELNEGNWDERKEETFDRAIDVVAEYAPNAKRSVISRYGLTPLDLERTLSLPRGDPFHGIATWDQMLSFRPLVGHADYRTPIANLYLCGAGVHPGGGVSGAPGHNAAKVALDDWKRGKIEEEIRAQVPKEKAKQVAQVISESGSVMMAIEGISREGDRLAVKGSVIGSWPSKMYVNLKDTLNMAKLILTPQVILYILSLPFLALKRKWREK
jgi:hypothetical protein